MARKSEQNKVLAHPDCSSQKASEPLPLVMKGDLVLMRCALCKKEKEKKKRRERFALIVRDLDG